MQKARAIFEENFTFIIIAFLTNYIPNTYAFSAKGVFFQLEYAVSLFFICCTLAALISFLPYKKLKNIIKITLLTAFLLVFIGDVIAVYSYGYILSRAAVAAILDTNPREIKEYIQNYLTFKLILIIILAVGLNFAAFYFLKKLLMNIKIKQTKLIKILTFLFGLFFLYITIRTPLAYNQFAKEAFFCVQRVAFNVDYAIKSNVLYAQMVKKSPDQASILKNDSAIKNIVIILGESTNKNHMSLYGYYLPTTPCLDELQRKNQLYVFNDVIINHPSTTLALQELFTYYNGESEKYSWYEYENLITTMHKAGYKTFWLSNQESHGLVGSTSKFFADKSEVKKFTILKDYEDSINIHDEKLLPLIDEAKNEFVDKNFVVVHLLGTHADYNKRYPEQFAKFTSQDIKWDLKPEQKQRTAEYANSILYNDYIIEQIINKFKDEEVLIIYISDHGDIVFDDGVNVGRGDGKKISIFSLEIPLIVWGSDKFKEKYPEKIAQIKQALSKPYMSDDFIHTVLNLADIKTKDYEPEKSIVNELFDRRRKRMYDADSNFDKDYDREILKAKRINVAK